MRVEIDEKDVQQAFERAVERLTDYENRQVDTRYISGVADALGWILGEYDDDPSL